jgi:hypothetical protein
MSREPHGAQNIETNIHRSRGSHSAALHSKIVAPGKDLYISAWSGYSNMLGIQTQNDVHPQ